MSKKGLAEKLGVATNTVYRYETGELAVSDDMLARVSKALAFPEQFFSGSDIDQPRRENASFRGLASKTAKIMDAALASAALAYLFDDWVANRYILASPDLPEFEGNISPHVAATLLRDQWGLGSKPIENMVHLLEAKGIRVFSLAENTKKVDAFSVWRDDVPYVFLNRYKSSERSRFDAAHELAHLCLHKHGGAVAVRKNSPAESEANSFAGAFLMPEEDLRANIRSTIYSVEDILIYKRRWRVSASAMVYRARELGLISEARSNSLYVEMSRRGWLKEEPRGIQKERSHVWQQVIDDLRASGITKSDVARETGVPIGELEALLFGLANMLSIEGGGQRTPKKSARLHVIKNERYA